MEKNEDAFSTFAENLINGKLSNQIFEWPTWLPKSAISTKELLGKYGKNLRAIKGKITLLAGGPPCQGFSLAGRRTQSDPRNALTDDYIELVRLLQPRFLLIENVRGFTMPFKKNPRKEPGSEPYSKRVESRLKELGYAVYSDLVDLSSFGVPQSRKRFILIAIRKGDTAISKLGDKTPIELLTASRKRFLASKRLPSERAISAKEAIGDLETQGAALIASTDSRYKTYVQVQYEDGRFTSPFIELMRKGATASPNSLRLPKHDDATKQQFATIMQTCARGKTLSDDDRKRFAMKKHALTPLGSSLPSATVTTLPDDMIHYSEPRILTARENARLQTFPDHFSFCGQYTTGGSKRKSSCPRYTQIGNAVPPLFAEAVGRVLKQLAS